ncbi:hypothetical protein [Herminiimonas sp. CN]|uniref:hypothetical protein n=1 Tax=Herminiimonas sp. CN TaxID=1349818 RepID=UPI00047423F1|nr:hypothetical protein [Herminiimonas sp. CN]
MTSTFFLTLIASAAVIASAAAVAGPDQAQAGDGHRASPMLQVVPNSSRPQDAAYGWQYFSDSRAVHAVVISPSGEYFLSLGDGLRQITGPAGQVLTVQ